MKEILETLEQVQSEKIPWSDEWIQNFIKITYELFNNHQKEKELLLKLLEACVVKKYKIDNPDADQVTVVSYYGGTKEEPDYFRTYLTFKPYDKEVMKFEKMFSQIRYRGLEVKTFNLSYVTSDKSIARKRK